MTLSKAGFRGLRSFNPAATQFRGGALYFPYWSCLYRRNHHGIVLDFHTVTMGSNHDTSSAVS